ncbi:hypothetical protein KCU88_g440, partial [Aureobasidium melanogenum]
MPLLLPRENRFDSNSFSINQKPLPSPSTTPVPLSRRGDRPVLSTALPLLLPVIALPSKLAAPLKTPPAPIVVRIRRSAGVRVADPRERDLSRRSIDVPQIQTRSGGVDVGAGVVGSLFAFTFCTVDVAVIVVDGTCMQWPSLLRRDSLRRRLLLCICTGIKTGLL